MNVFIYKINEQTLVNYGTVNISIAICKLRNVTDNPNALAPFEWCRFHLNSGTD